MTTWSDIAPTIAKAAPLLGSLLGPVGTIAGGAVGAIISSVTGAPPNDPDAAAKAIAANPELLEKLREAELANQALLASYALQQRQAEFAAQSAADAQRTAQFQAEAADRANARQLASTQTRDFVRPGITATLLVGAILIVIAVFSGWADGLLRDATASLTIGTLIGYWFNELKQTLAFWFGMTADSSSQARAITQFAVSPGTVTAEPVVEQAQDVVASVNSMESGIYRGH